MFDATSFAGMDLSKIVLSIGGLGTAAYGVVDATKGFGGGISNRGFGDIKKVVTKLIPQSGTASGREAAASLDSSLRTLRANWLNGMVLGDQKAVAKALVKLNLTPGTAPHMADATGVQKSVLEGIAGKLGTNEALSPEETNVY